MKGRSHPLKNKQKKGFKLFDMNRDGKGAVEENRKPTFSFFFKSLFRKFPQLLRLNILMLLQVIPILVVIFVYFLGEKSPVATNATFAPLYGIGQVGSAAQTAPLLDLSSIQMGVPVLSPVVIYVVFALLLLLAITWGWQNVGATYVLRGLVRGDAVFVFSDFFYAIKRNLKQGFFMGLMDFIFCLVLVVDFLFFNQQTGSFGVDFMYFTIFALIIIYFIVRFYIYLLLVTFDMKNFKILKHALIFSVLGIKRNILAFLGIVLLTAIHVAIAIMLIPMGISVTIVIPFVYILAATAFMAAYAAFPVIDKYMIAPYASESVEEEEEFMYLKDNSEEDASSDSSVAEDIE